MKNKKLQYAYYPGCAAKQIQKEADISARAICKKLGITLHNMPSATCCGAGNLQESDPAAALAVNARIFSEAEEMGHDIITICNTCLQTFRYAYERLQDDDLRSQINEVLETAGVRPFQNTIEPKHLIWVLMEDLGEKELKKHIKNPLNGLRVAPFYGCHSIRPSKLHDSRGGENPQHLDGLIKIIGGESVEYNGKDKCCGFHYMLVKEKDFLKMSGGHSLEAKNAGAEVMTSPCTLCDLALGVYQERSEKALNSKINLPELSIQQLIGTALGVDSEALGYHMLHRDPRPAMRAHRVKID